MSADADASPIRNAFGELWRDLAHVGLSLALGKIYSRYRKKCRFRFFLDFQKNLDFRFRIRESSITNNNVVYDSDDEGADLKCKEHLDLAVTADPSNAEAFHTLASYWLCKGDRQVYHL